jgi:hypothetical protein
MERALLLLSSTSTRENEEKIAGLALMNQILHQMIQKYSNSEQENEKKLIAIDFILEKVYEKVTVSFIVSLLGSLKFPEIQKISLEFLSFHLLSLPYLSLYLSSASSLFFIFFHSLTSQSSSSSAPAATVPSYENKEFSQQLYIVIYHILMICQDEKVLIDLIHQSLSASSFTAPSSSSFSSGPSSFSPPSVTILQVFNDLLYFLSTILNKKEIETPFLLSEESSVVLISLFIKGLYGSAPEVIHDGTLYYCYEVLQQHETFSPQWLLSSVPSSNDQKTEDKTTKKKRQQSCFLFLLLSIIFNDLHLNEEELLCGYQDLHALSSSPSSSESEVEKKRLLARYYRCFHSFLNCLHILEVLITQIIPSFFNEDVTAVASASLFSKELLEMKAIFSRINKEILSFIIDSCESMQTVIEMNKQRNEGLTDNAEDEEIKQLTTLQRILLSKSISYARLYYHEDPQLSNEEHDKDGINEEMLFKALKGLLSISTFSSFPLKSTSQEKAVQLKDLIITVNLPSPSYHVSKGEPTLSVLSSFASEVQSVDSSFLVLLFVADIFTDHVDNEDNSQEEKERSFVVIDKVVDMLSILLDQTMKLMQCLERNFNTGDSTSFSYLDTSVATTFASSGAAQELAQQSVIAGLSVFRRIILLRIIDLQYLLRVEGGKTAFYNLINCQQQQINDFYYLLKGIVKAAKGTDRKGVKEIEKGDDQDCLQLVQKIFSLLDSLALEDSFSETVESL